MQSLIRRRIPGQVGGRRIFIGGPAFIVHNFRGNVEFFGSIPRGLIRRQITSSTGQVFRRRLFVGGQGLTLVSTHMRGGLESVAALRQDYPGSTESVRNLLGDITTALEATAARRVDFMTALEYTGAVTLTSQGTGQLEITAVLSADRSATNEFVASITTDRVARLESLARVSHEAAGSLEDLFLIAGHSAGAAEFLAGSLVNSVGRLEALTTRRTEAITEVEALGLSLIVANVLSPIEVLTGSLHEIGSGQAEFLRTQRFDRAGALEYLGQAFIVGSSVGALEYLSTIASDRLMPGEALARTQLEATALVEFLTRLITDQRSPLEAPSAVGRDARSTIEFLVSRTTDNAGQIEMSVQHHIDIAAPISVVQQLTHNPRGSAEYSGSLASTFSSGGFIEILSTIASETSSAAESSLVRLNVLGGPIEYVAGVRVNAVAFSEILASFLVDWHGPVETLTSVTVSFDMLANLEIAGFAIGFDCCMAVLESGATIAIGHDPISGAAAALEYGATITLDTRGLLEEGAAVQDFSTLNLSIGRARLITVPYTSADLPPFDPLRVGEIDTFAFDFTPDVGAATIDSTSWICTLQPSPAIDSSPQARVIVAMPATQLFTNSPIANEVQVWNGAFSVAILGTFPASATGGNYVLEATAILSDKRVLKATSSVLCAGASVH